MYYLQHDKNVFGANEGLKAAIKRFKMILNNWYKKVWELDQHHANSMFKQTKTYNWKDVFDE